MMESNCELKLTNMKTQSTQPRKEKFNDSFFIRKQMHDPITENDKQRSIQQTNAIHNNNISNLTIAAKAGNDGAVKTTGIENPQKNSFMKTFLRKPFVIAIAVVIANLFLANHSNAQIAQIGTATNANTTGTTLTINKPSRSCSWRCNVRRVSCKPKTMSNTGGEISNASRTGWTR